jgi:hypothetical protein
MRKLDQTLDFIELFTHHVGTREVPEAFDMWTAISLIATSVGNRVWYEKFEGKKLTPNMFIVLMGPSACGKGVAIDDGLDYVSHIPLVNMYRGKVTAAYMVDRLSSSRKKWGSALLYLVTPELSLSVGSGHLADEFVKMMTELFTGGNYEFQHGTRTSGNVTFSGHCINWFGGSTKDWFIQALSKEAIEGGALGRIVVVREPYRDIRIPRPTRSPDFPELRRHLQARVYNLLYASGPFHMTEKAEALQDQWYMDRNRPDEGSPLLPSWRRQDDLVLKLAMICSLSSGRSELVITGDDFTRARNLSDTALKSAEYLIPLASSTKETEGYHYVKDAIKRAHRIQRQALTKMMARRGLMGPKVQEFIVQLKEEGEVEEVVTGRTTWYKWMKG